MSPKNSPGEDAKSPAKKSPTKKGPTKKGPTKTGPVKKGPAERSPGAPQRRPLASGEYVDRVLDDETDTQIYFAPSGGKIPKRNSMYVLGALITVIIIALAIFAIFVAVAAKKLFGEFPGIQYVVIVPVALLFVFSLIAPFLRRRRSAEGRFIDGLLRGDFVAVTRTPLATRLAEAAHANRPDYYAQAEELARASALRVQAEQMEELSGAASVSGPDAERMKSELDDYARRLGEAATYREGLVAEYLEGKKHA